MEKMLDQPLTTAAPAETAVYQMLLARAHRKTGRVPADLIVRHILSVTAVTPGESPARED
jgi:hypothetical protein